MRFVIYIRITILAACVFMQACLIGGAGSIKGYSYETNKDELEMAINQLLKKDSNVYRDTVRNYLINTTNGKNDTMDDNMYNDGKNYMTIKVKVPNGEYKYIFRFYGDEQYWKTSPIAEIFIVYAYDEKDNGGSAGDGGINGEIREKLISVFESKFIAKVDKELKVKHIDTR